MTESTSNVQAPPARLARPDGHAIAYRRTPGEVPGVVFCGGYASDMTGTKAVALEEFCRARGRAFVRFDYLGHGASSGDFADGTIGRWADDAIAVIDELTEGPQVLVGSSMGGWIMLLAALARRARIAALVGIAAAPDFTEAMWEGLDDARRETLMREGVVYEPSDYSDQPYAITRALIEDGRDQLLLGGPIRLACPVRLLQGMADTAVPWRTALKIAERLESGDVEVHLVKDGDHRLSEPADIARLTRTLAEVLERAGDAG